MGLAKYIKKRKFDVTPEPRGEVERSKGSLKFVVQKHQASRLHYDFRLEMEGVMKSWAVPKGPSLNPKDKRLAMMTEDHPLSYRTFEGTIPYGEYGGGDVIVWDEGTYESDEAKGVKGEAALLAGVKRGDIKFTLHGKKLQGSFALVKTKGWQENAWLLIKHNDEFTSTDDIVSDESSVRSKKSLGNKPHAKIVESMVKQKAPKKKQAPKSTALVKPMLARLADEPFDNPDWIYEIKWDGYRAIAEVRDSAVRLYSRNAQPFEKKYPAVVEALKAIEHNVVLDGEVVSVDNAGKSRFQYLQDYIENKKGHLQYQVFDLLELDGQDVRGLTLLQRKELLQKVLPESDVIKFSDHIAGKGITFFNQAIKQDLEGIMAKDGNSMYTDGARSSSWLKIKTHNRQEAIICGYTAPRGTRKYFGSLILGLYKEGKLTYVGHTGTGFNQESLQYIAKKLHNLEQKTSSFSERIKTNAPVTWVQPKLLCEVEFTEWTDDGQMRHPSFQGLRNDKQSETVVAEIPQNNKLAELELTNLDKIYWPKDKITKGDLINYYRAIAPTMLPYLKDRLQSMNRFPNGITGKNFYQKNVDNEVPTFVRTEEVQLEDEDRSITSIVCDNVETLLYMANLGCIEINTWNSRVSKYENPDWGVIDLDPGDIGFDKVIEVALEVHKVLESINIPSVPKTSGKTGLHIFIPMGAKYTHDQVRQFIEILMNVIHKRLPDITSLERSPKKRTKLIYLDYLQNRIGQTLAAPYSVRPWPGATVSTPLEWREVHKNLDPNKFTIYNTAKRLKVKGDLWKPVIGKGVNLSTAIKKLQKLLSK